MAPCTHVPISFNVLVKTEEVKETWLWPLMITFLFYLIYYLPAGVSICARCPLNMYLASVWDGGESNVQPSSPPLSVQHSVHHSVQHFSSSFSAPGPDGSSCLTQSNPVISCCEGETANTPPSACYPPPPPSYLFTGGNTKTKRHRHIEILSASFLLIHRGKLKDTKTQTHRNSIHLLPTYSQGETQRQKDTDT